MIRLAFIRPVRIGPKTVDSWQGDAFAFKRDPDRFVIAPPDGDEVTVPWHNVAHCSPDVTEAGFFVNATMRPLSPREVEAMQGEINEAMERLRQEAARIDWGPVPENPMDVPADVPGQQETPRSPRRARPPRG